MSDADVKQWMDYDGNWHDFASVTCPICGEVVEGETDAHAAVNLGWHQALGQQCTSHGEQP